jgi:membrane dipeptidase
MNPLKTSSAKDCGRSYCENLPLNDLGKKVIGEMKELGVVADVSHMGPRPFQELLKVIEAPFIVSHASLAKISLGEYYDGWSNGSLVPGKTADLFDGAAAGGTEFLDDNTIKTIIQHGGVIALHFLSPFVDHINPQTADVEKLVDEIAYIKNSSQWKNGIDYLALGPDYFPLRGGSWITGANNMTKIHAIARVMVSRKNSHSPNGREFSDEDIRKVLGKNLMRVYQKVWKN